MRRAFLRAFGQPPQALRRTARGGSGVEDVGFDAHVSDS